MGRGIEFLHMQNVIADTATECGDFLYAAIESLPHLAWLCDAKGNCFYANRPFSDYCRNALGDKARLNWLDLISRDEEANTVEQWMEATPSGAPFARELRLRARSGEMRWFGVDVVPILEPGGGVRFWFGLGIDLTARKRREADALASQMDLDAALTQNVASLTVSAMAHDLNQPLAAGGTYASVAMRLLRSKVTDRDTFEHALEQVIREIRRAGRMFKEFSDEIPSEPPVMECCDLAQLAHDAVVKLREKETLDTLQVTVTTLGSVGTVMANRVWLERSLHALIQLRAPAASEPDAATRDVVVSVMPSADGMCGQITIQHRGAPLDDDTIRALFKPHYSFKSGKVGLELALHRALITAQGGEFWTEPNRHEGPAYCITLPLAACAGAERAP